MRYLKLQWLVIAALIVALFASYAPAKADLGVVINFEGLQEGAIVSSVSLNSGISGEDVPGMVAVNGHNPFFQNKNAAMIYDAACTGGCTGGDNDLYDPIQGNVLIVSQNMDSGNPDDARNPGTYLTFDYSQFGTGKVTVESLAIGDIDENEAGGTIDLYSDGADGTLLKSVEIPVTGNGVYKRLEIGVSGVDYMRVNLVSSAAIDNIRVSPDLPEVLYQTDTATYGDGITNLYRVEIDEAAGRANLILMPNGVLPYDHVDTLASTPDGTKLYFVNEIQKPAADQQSTLAYYDVATATVHEIGQVTVNGVRIPYIDQAAFSPDGVLYITSSSYDSLFQVDLDTAAATSLGKIVDTESGAVVNISGADIAFASDGTFFLWVNHSRGDAPRGLYSLTLPPVNDQVLASFIGTVSDEHGITGLALRHNGTGEIVCSSEADEIHVISRTTGDDLVPPLAEYYNGEPFNSGPGDMSIGPFAQFFFGTGQ